MLSLVVYVPDTHVEEVKDAMFAAGAGRIGNYDRCCWQTIGQGQFRPLPGSQPAIGSQLETEVLDEWKIEMVCEADYLQAAIEAMKQAHPYETPAYLVIKPL